MKNMTDPKRTKNIEEQEIEQAPTTIGIGDIFTDGKYYYMYAEWCNSNGCHIEEIEPKEDGTRQFQIKKPKEPTLEELKERKLNELNSKASSFEQTENKDMFLTSSLGFRVNADPKAKRNIDTLIELQAQTFRDYDNEIHTDITVQDLETIKREISLNAVNLYNQKWTMESEINDLKTIEEIEDFKVKFEMLNFNK